MNSLTAIKTERLDDDWTALGMAALDLPKPPKPRPPEPREPAPLPRPPKPPQPPEPWG